MLETKYSCACRETKLSERDGHSEKIRKTGDESEKEKKHSSMRQTQREREGGSERENSNKDTE